MPDDKKRPSPIKSEQPRSATLKPVPEDRTIRASLYAEQQKFVSPDKAKELQLQLFEDRGKTVSEGLVDVGLNLSSSEGRALHAVQVLFSDTDYKGNCPARAEYVDAYHETFNLPRITITWSDYYEACDVPRTDGRYQGKRAQTARDALLNGLQKLRPIMYERRYLEEKKERFAIIRGKVPLVRVVEVLEDLGEEEARRVKAGEELSRRVTKLCIEAGPLMVDRIDSFWFRKPRGFYKEIEQYTGSKRRSRAIEDFLNYLLTLGRTPHTIGKDTLINKIKPLRKIKERREQKLLDERLQECLETATGMGYLTDYSENEKGILKLHLDTGRCKLALKGKGRGKKPTKSAAAPAAGMDFQHTTSEAWSPGNQQEPDREVALSHIEEIQTGLNKPASKEETR